MTNWLHKLGPGLLFAASAVGVSHLVQSTRAGAQFGLSMGVLILAVCLLKYPAFRFGGEYAAITRESLLDGYARQGRLLLSVFLVAIVIEGFAVIPAVSLVAAGMTLNLAGISGDEIRVTIVIVIAASIALAIGRYRLLEQLSRIFVIVFAVLTVVATVATLGLLGSTGAIAAPITPTRQNLFFSVAVAGWMPVGMGGAVLLSLWVLARSELQGRPVSRREALFDFNVSYAVTTVLALCFLLMGTGLLFGRDVTLVESSAGFAAQLIALFSASVGAWIGPVVAVTALAVIFSTVIAVVDGFPRLYANVTRRLLGHSAATGEKRLYLVFMAAQAIVATALLSLFVSSFGTFIDFSTTAGFIVAPVVAFLNHRIMLSDTVGFENRPPRWIMIWSAFGIAALTLASLVYLYFRFV
jgi:Mn2+/Fe2+ NRAMP family transporter